MQIHMFRIFDTMYGVGDNRICPRVVIIWEKMQLVHELRKSNYLKGLDVHQGGVKKAISLE